MLQVGIVVAQPATVSPRCAYHIYKYAYAHEQEVAVNVWQELKAAAADRQDSGQDKRCHRQGDRPQRSLVVLKHGEQDNDCQGDDCQEVEQSSDDVVHVGVVAYVLDIHGEIPCVAQRHGCKEGSGPPAQTQWRRNLRGKGVASTKQQIAASNQAQYCHSAI